MKQKFAKAYEKKKYNIIASLRIFILVLCIFIQSAFLISTYSNFTNAEDYQEPLPAESFQNALIPEPDKNAIKEAENRRIRIENENKVNKVREEKINKLLAFLKKYKSPVATRHYAALIIDLSAKSGSDYRILVAIMGKESGFCRAPIGTTHNCFGYLNRVKYSSWDAAFKDLIPKISRQYANKYGWDFESLAKAYGQVNWQECATKMRYYASQL